eukprot:6260607-Alexandrium_andersonii.AAC.1
MLTLMRWPRRCRMSVCVWVQVCISGGFVSGFVRCGRSRGQTTAGCRSSTSAACSLEGPQAGTRARWRRMSPKTLRLARAAPPD